jgi:hypothetical protein
MKKLLLVIALLFPVFSVAQDNYLSPALLPKLKMDTAGVALPPPHVFAVGPGFSVPPNRVMPINIVISDSYQVTVEDNKMTFLVGGIYMLTARIQWQFNGNWAGSVWFQKNDGHEPTVDSLMTETTQNLSITPPPIGGWITPQKYSAAGQFRLVAGDYLKLFALHSSVFPQNFTQINLEITRIAD